MKKSHKLNKLCSVLLAVCLLASAIVVPAVTKADTASEEKKNINILLIGNSYAADTVNYLAEIYDSAGYDTFNIVSLYYPGATLSRIYEELLLSETAEANGFNDRTSGVYKYGAKLTTTRNTGAANNNIQTDNSTRSSASCFAYQKYTKEDGAVKSHNTVFNYDLKKAITEADWDVVSLQNINNSYDATEEAAYHVLKAGTDDSYGDYSTAFTFNNTTYYAGKEYIGKEYVSILTDYIKSKKSDAEVFFNSTWVPEYSAIRSNGTANNHTPRTAQKNMGTFSQGYSAYEWEKELNTNVYKYLTDKTEDGNNLSGIVKNNTLVEYLYENLPLISDSYSLWRDNTHLIDIGRYAAALNFYYTVSGVDFSDTANRIAFVPSFEIRENLSCIYDCLSKAKSDEMPKLSTVKYYDSDFKLLKTEYYFVGSTVRLYDTKEENSYPSTVSGDASAIVKMRMPVENTEYNLYFTTASADVSNKKSIADELPEYITAAQYDKVTDIYNRFYEGDMSNAEFDALYKAGYIEKVDNAKRRVDALKANNSYFFEDFDTNNIKNKATASVVPMISAADLERAYKDKADYLVDNGLAYWATTEGTGDNTTDKYKIQNADKTFTYYETLLSKQGNNIRTELVIFPDNSMEALATPVVKTNSKVDPTTAATLNGNVLFTPYTVYCNDYRYRTDGFGQYRNSMPNQIYKIDEKAFGGRSISEISFKLGANVGHVGEKLVIITSYTDPDNYEGYFLNNNTVLQKIVRKNGMVSGAGQISATTNFVAASSEFSGSTENDPYVSGTEYITMRYNGSTYTLEHIYDATRQKGDNKQKVKAVFTLNENIDMLKSFYFTQNGSNYFDNFEIKTVDIDKVNNFAEALDINAITSDDIAEIKDVYAECENIAAQGLSSKLGSGTEEKLKVANTIAEYLEKTGASSFDLPSKIDALSNTVSKDDYKTVEDMYTQYTDFCSQGLSTLFTSAQARKITMFNEIAKAAEAKALDSYDASEIVSLVESIDILKAKNTNLSTEFSVMLKAAEKSYEVLNKAGFGAAVVNKSELDAVRTAYDALKASGSYVDGSSLKFVKTGYKYSNKTNGSWNSSAQSGEISLIDFDTSNGIDEISFTIPATGNQSNPEAVFVYSYSGDKNNDGFADISGIGFQNPYDGNHNRAIFENITHRETPYTDTLDNPLDCAFWQSNWRNYGNSNYPVKRGNWVKTDMIDPDKTTGAADNNLLNWYISANGFDEATSSTDSDFNTWKTENNYDSCRITGNVKVTMTYLGDVNAAANVSGFSWYEVKFTATFWCYRTGESKSNTSYDTKELTLYSRLFTNGRIKNAGITHASNVEPETVLKNVSLKVNNTATRLTNGASVRIADVANGGGIRFESKVNTNLYNSLKNTAGVKVELGTIIVPEEYRAGKDITFDNFKTASQGGSNEEKNLCVDIRQTKWQDEANGIYTAALINLKKANYTKQFSARGYMKVTYADSSVEYFYSDFDKDANVRSISQVATEAIKDSDSYTSEQLAILKVFAGQ